MADFVKVAGTGDIPPGASREVDANGKSIAVFNVEGSYYAVDNTCPHVGGPLSDGEVNGTVVSCPWHAASFDLATGEARGGPAPTGVACYQVRVTGDAVEVEV